jgi:transcriptional regulator with XRE-family HTH domain
MNMHHNIIFDRRQTLHQARNERTAKHKIVGELRQRRIEQRISQEAVGAALGLNRNAILKYEMGWMSPKIKMLCDWADFIGYEIVLQKKQP